MPLVRIPGEEAVATRKTNPVAFWGTRSAGNRVEPVARPEFHPSFRLEAGEKIFTIGSCFARHVENQLIKRGFKIPVRELMDDPLFADLEIGVLDNYGTPSICNELSWAFDPATPFVPADHLLEVKPGRFVDIHLKPTLEPASWDVVLARRTSLRQLMRLAADCRVVIITLGLSEVWFDTATGFYLNDTVRPALIRLHPGRFELHVLSYEDALGYLDKALLLLRANSRHDLRIVLTVSPVVLTATHRPMDVIVANTYSKSMLRTVAETVCAKYDWIDYYPSYESVTLSDRKIAWESDLIHVTTQMIAMNVERMLDRYLGSTESLEDLRARIAAGGRLAAEELAIDARRRGGKYAKAFFREFNTWSEESSVFAMEHAQFLFSQGDHGDVIRVLAQAPKESEPLAVGLLRAQAELKFGRAADAIATLTPLSQAEPLSQPTWEQLVHAYAQNNDADGAIAATQRYLSAMPYMKIWAFLNLARAFREGDPERAAHYYELVLEDFLDSDEWIQFEIADFLTQHRKFDAARRMVAHLKPRQPWLEVKVSILRALLGVDRSSDREVIA